MALEIIWTKKSTRDFNAIQIYLLNTWGESSVKKFSKKIFNFLILLSEYPFVGTLENKHLNIRGFVVVKQATLFYQVRDTKIILLGFYDNRQDPKERRYE